MNDDTEIRDSLRRTMVDTQVRPSDVTKFPIIEALLHTPRESYVPETLAHVAYADLALTIAPGRELMEPRSFAKMLDALDLHRDDLSLIVGGGLGYSAAVIGHMVDSVVMVEEDPQMAHAAEQSLSDAGIHNVAVLEAPLTAGAPKAGPYAVIFIEGAIETLPDSLAAQLQDGGRIIAGFGTDIRLGIKSGGKISWRSVFDGQLALLPGFERARSFAL